MNYRSKEFGMYFSNDDVKKFINLKSNKVAKIWSKPLGSHNINLFGSRRRNMKEGTRFVIRTINSGKVKINNRWFKPSDQYKKYDGRLDGLRYAFGIYWVGETNILIMDNFLSLWGPEDQYNQEMPTDHSGPHVVDGNLPWNLWVEIKE